MKDHISEVHYGKHRDLKHHEKRNYKNKCGEQNIVLKMEVSENDKCMEKV